TTLNSQPQNPIHTISFSLLSFFFSLLFLSSSFSFPLQRNAESFFFFFRNYLKTLFTQLECLLWISEGDAFLLGFLPLFIEKKLALLTYVMSSAISIFLL
ncbi:hypothetical protein ACMBCN_03205, partial [Candidatus Liberibacter asiaticus]